MYSKGLNILNEQMKGGYVDGACSTHRGGNLVKKNQLERPGNRATNIKQDVEN